MHCRPPALHHPLCRQRKRHRSSAALHNADAPVGVGMLAAFSAKLVVSKIWIQMIQKYKEKNIDNGHNHICPNLPFAKKNNKISTSKRFTLVNSPKHDGDSFMGVIIISIPTNDLSFKPFSVSVNVNNGYSHLPIFVSSETKNNTVNPHYHVHPQKSNIWLVVYLPL